MYLSKIEILGFKSFAHRVRISFDKGLTAIVGPNGCGKTNVVDAIRWVLGEQRTTLLRSTKMENIIFNGSKNLKPLSLTEVSITIENTRNVLPTEYTEVTVTRRLYRNGESDYLLNQVPCRLKDILDLFTDTGMGSDAYSVIELKMIEEIISNKSEERLKLFEEAAGITRYKQRRKQTFKQLESASRDLARVDDVIAEVEKKVRSLKLQVKKAEKLRELKSEIRTTDLLLAGLTLHDELEKLDPLKKLIEHEECLCHELAATIAGRESELQDAELLQLRHEEQLSASQKELNGISAVIHDLEKKLLLHEEQQKSLFAAKNSIRIALKEKQEKILMLEKRKDELLERKKPLEKNCHDRLEAYRRLSGEQDRLNLELQAHRSGIAETRKEISEREKALNRLILEKNGLETRKQQLRSVVERAESSKNAAIQKTGESTILRKQLESEISRQASLLEQARDEESRLKNRIDDLGTAIEMQKEELLSLRAERAGVDNRISLADAVLENFDGLPEGIEFLEKQKSSEADQGCLADMISLDPAYRKAVHAALGDALSYYVCRSIAEAKLSMQQLRLSKKGKLHFLVLDLIARISDNETQVREGARRMVDIIGYPEALSAALNNLLYRYYLVDTLDTAENLSRQDPNAVFVTPEGEKFSGRGLLYGGSSSNSEGVRLGKKSERDLLLNRHALLQSKITGTEGTLRQLQAELETVKKERQRVQTEKLQQEIRVQEKKLAHIEAEEHALRQTIRHAEQEVAELLAGVTQLDIEAAAFIPEITEKENALQLLLENIQQAQERLTGLETRHHRLSHDVQAGQSLHRDAELELEKLLFSLNASSQTLRAVHDDIRKLERETADTTEKINRTELTVTGLKKQLENHLLSAAAGQESLKKLESVCRELQSGNQQSRTIQRELRRKHEVSRELVEQLVQQQSQAEQQLDHLLTSIQVRYGCELKTVEPSELPGDFNRTSSAERLAVLQKQREQFGAVNELALEEYESEKERLDFLITQKEDLFSAETQLRDTIEEINKTALLKFRETYAAVRKNFITIFHELFDPEDEVDLLCSSTEDPLDAHIEIVAKPRGKKPLSIEQLSGGEKALTALSLLFAIYLVKPSPFCILDEVDAPLDDANVGRFIKLLKKFENNTQFIIVTHNKKSMASCQALYGVTMEEEGVSKLIPVRLEKTGF